MIQYVHYNINIDKGFKKTFAFKVPSAKSFFKAIKNRLSSADHKALEIEIGISKVNPEDNYSKAIGREFSKERLKKKSFLIVNINFSEEDKVDLLLIEQENLMAIKVGLKMGKSQARVLGIQIDEEKLLKEV